MKVMRERQQDQRVGRKLRIRRQSTVTEVRGRRCMKGAK